MQESLVRTASAQEIHFLAEEFGQGMTPIGRASRKGAVWSLVASVCLTLLLTNSAWAATETKTVWLYPQEVWQGPVPYVGTFPAGTINGHLQSVRFPGQTAASGLYLVKLGHSTAECGNIDAVVPLLPNQSTTQSNLQSLYGSTTPVLPVTFVACVGASETPGSVFITVTYDFVSTPPPPPAPPSLEGSQALVVDDAQFMFVVRPDFQSLGALRQLSWSPRYGFYRTDLFSGISVGRPSAIRVGDQVHVFARDSVGRIFHYFWGKDFTWTTDYWGDASGADPTAILIGDQQHVFYTGTDNSLKHVFWSPGTGFRSDVWGSGVTGRPTAMVTGDQQHVFARGTDGTLRHWFWAPYTGIRPDTWGTGLAGDPAAILIGDQQHVFATGTDGHLKHWYWAQAGGLRSDVWGDGVTGRPSVMLVGAQQHVFARGSDGSLQHWFWEPQGGLHHDIWGRGLAGDPTSILIGNQQHVFATGDDGTLQHWFWEPVGGLHHDNWGR
jgi:hypothetical protein